MTMEYVIVQYGIRNNGFIFNCIEYTHSTYVWKCLRTSGLLVLNRYLMCLNICYVSYNIHRNSYNTPIWKSTLIVSRSIDCANCVIEFPFWFFSFFQFIDLSMDSRLSFCLIETVLVRMLVDLNGIIVFKMVLMFHWGIGTVLWRAKVLPFNVPANHQNCMEGTNYGYWWDFGRILVDAYVKIDLEIL